MTGIHTEIRSNSTGSSYSALVQNSQITKIQKWIRA